MNSYIYCPLILSLSLLGSALLGAQDGRVQVTEPAHHAAYVLGPEDQIVLHVVDLDDVSDKPVRIDPSGFIDLPLIGKVHAAGLSVDQLRSTLAERLAKYIDLPQINISVLDYRSQAVSVLGSVNTPGLHELQGPKRLLEVISLAGGLRQDAGPRLTITREIKWGALPLTGAHADSSGQFSIADVRIGNLTSGRDPVENIEVRPNDVISVSRTEVVYVVGEVKKAGGFSLDSEDSISMLRALSLAEGLTHDAAPKKARILRPTSSEDSSVNEIPINVQQVLNGKAPDLQLRANDVLFIPNNVPASAMKRATEAALQITTGLIIFR